MNDYSGEEGENDSIVAEAAVLSGLCWDKPAGNIMFTGT